MKTVAFFIRHFTERGTEVSAYNYAHYNETILGNKSLIICHTISKHKLLGWDIYDQGQPSRKKFEKRFKVIEIDDIKDIKFIIKTYSITHFYTQSSGFPNDIYRFNERLIWSDCMTIYHTVFGTSSQGSDILCTISNHINKRNSTNLTVIPYIVEPHETYGNLRDYLNIPQDSIVFGRHGGFDTFNIKFVHIEIIKYLDKDKNSYFLFLNTEQFIDHPRVIHINKSTTVLEKNLFIDTCDIMIHGRKEGETFGLAVAEFSAANKPVITFSGGDTEHINILKDKAIIYNNQNQLSEIFQNSRELINSKTDWNAYKEYRPRIIMEKFNAII